MQAALKHRGPDSQGMALSKQVIVAMRRLSIIDVSGGDQPLYNEDESVEIVGNGEIYNYVELQKDLKKKGHTLRTGSDIETVAHLYETYGLDCVKKLRGMFALILHDKKRNRTVLMRDRMGEKPLYYTTVSDGVIFASEMKSLLAHTGVDMTLDYDSILKYFYYYYVPEPDTVLKAVKKLPPAHIMVVDNQTGECKLVRYWDPAAIAVTHHSDPTAKIREVFSQTCELTLRSDVPVGITLSGGIDSGAILSLSAPKYKDTMKAFSVGYEGGASTDERKMAKDLADKYKVEFFDVEITTRDVVKNFPRLVWEGDDPIADIAGSGISAVYKLARKNGVKVILGGIGGDELFWGYPWLREAVQSNLQQKRFPFGRDTMKFYENTPSFHAADTFLKKLFMPRFSRTTGPVVTPARKQSELATAQEGLAQIRDIWLVSNCIALNDRLSMAASVELRSPFLDYKLVEAALSSEKIVLGYKDGQKYWLRKAMRGIVPDEVLDRPKRGFTPPVSEWLKALISTYHPLLKNGWLVQSGVINPKSLEVALSVWKTLPMYWYSYYQLILLEIWGREYIWKTDPDTL